MSEELLILKHEPTHYSSPEVVERVKSALTHVKNELSELVKSELVGDWYHWKLQVGLEGPRPYLAIVAHEVEGKISYIFESLRINLDGEILYRGCTIDEDCPELYQELVSEARRQYSWSKTRQEREEELSQRVQLADDALKRLQNDYPGLARNIRMHSRDNCTFSLTFPGLTEAQVRETLVQFFQKKTCRDRKSGE